MFYSLPRGPGWGGGVKHFQGVWWDGAQTFSWEGGGLEMFISIESFNLRFPGGQDPVYPPLDLRMKYISIPKPDIDTYIYRGTVMLKNKTSDELQYKNIQIQYQIYSNV